MDDDDDRLAEEQLLRELLATVPLRSRIRYALYPKPAICFLIGSFAAFCIRQLAIYAYPSPVVIIHQLAIHACSSPVVIYGTRFSESFDDLYREWCTCQSTPIHIALPSGQHLTLEVLAYAMLKNSAEWYWTTPLKSPLELFAIRHPTLHHFTQLHEPIQMMVNRQGPKIFRQVEKYNVVVEIVRDLRPVVFAEYNTLQALQQSLQQCQSTQDSPSTSWRVFRSLRPDSIVCLWTAYRTRRQIYQSQYLWHQVRQYDENITSARLHILGAIQEMEGILNATVHTIRTAIDSISKLHRDTQYLGHFKHVTPSEERVLRSLSWLYMTWALLSLNNKGTMAAARAGPKLDGGDTLTLGNLDDQAALQVSYWPSWSNPQSYITESLALVDVCVARLDATTTWIDTLVIKSRRAARAAHLDWIKQHESTICKPEDPIWKFWCENKDLVVLAGNSEHSSDFYWSQDEFASAWPSILVTEEKNRDSLPVLNKGGSSD